MSDKAGASPAEKEITSTFDSNKYTEKETQYQLIYSLLGLIFGLFCVVGGIIILIDLIIESTGWPVNLVGTRGALGAVPGFILLATGISIIWLTRFGRDKEKIDQRLHALNGWIWSIHAEAQSLQDLLSEIRKNCEITDEKDFNQEVKASIKDANEIFSIDEKQIKDYLKKVKELMGQAPEIHDQYGDKAIMIENLWEKASKKWEKSFKENTTPTKKEILRNISTIDELLSKIIYYACLVALPVRIGQHLEKMRVGQPLDFHGTFKDKMPRRDTVKALQYSKKILTYIYLHPAIIWGAVDVENGLIYKASPKLRRRYLSYILTMWAPFLGVFLIPLLLHYGGSFLNLQTWWFMKQSIPNLIAGCLFVTLGGFFHIAIDILKQNRITFKQIRSGEQKPSLLPQNWLIWFHVKELTFSIGVVTLWVGFLIFVFYFKDIENIKTAFLIGYSIDSVIDIFLQRFTKIVSTGSEALISQIT